MATKKKSARSKIKKAPVQKRRSPLHEDLDPLEAASIVSGVTILLLEDVARSSTGEDATDTEVCQLAAKLMARAIRAFTSGRLPSKTVRSAFPMALLYELEELPK